jgi:Transposase DNA-binding
MESVVIVLDNKQRFDENFQKCDLGDARRTKRLIKVAESMVDAPDESLPSQSPDWADLKATYRLFDNEEATFEAICEPHWKQTGNTKNGAIC